ncbi:hypothetical protein [Planctomyces sp. SH-PL62]|uniref:hypothetical protein n=1 Tax=Planctomyces sp. SH-PL62 TaxID=1636152 RepID=UPI00078DB15E|nr:hypothetical protein [Planctomyces sp. SH-PL62]AMV35989.1 hypothetical protein VT85_00995 [Planctomyces sp. SH-PL62]
MTRRPPIAAPAILALLLALAPAASAQEPTDRYETRDVEGWTVRVHRDLPRDEPELASRAMSLLADQLRAIVRVVPPEAVAKLRMIPIWVERAEPHHPCMAYHPDAGWLREHDMNPDKARCVEIANARNFLDWCRDQPWMVLHELAHGYHHQFVEGSFANSEIASALERAREAKTYEKVLHINGREQRHYALTNPMEYFAEASESLFGVNDFYPFVRAELARHDAEVHALLRRLWLVEPSDR